MPLSATEKDELKAGLSMSRKRPVNFGLSIAPKPEDTVILTHRSKKPDMLQRNAKKAAGSPKTACGTLESKGMKLTMTCSDKPPPGAAKKLRQFFKAAVGMSVKITLIGPGGYIEEDGEDQTEQPTETANEPDPQKAEPVDDGASKLVQTVEAALKKLQPQIDQAIAVNDKVQEMVSRLQDSVRKAGAAGNVADVKKRLAQLDELLSKVAASVAQKAGSGLSLAKLGKARIEWPKTRDQAMADLERLKKHIKNEYSDMPEAKGEVTNALSMLDKSLAKFQANLHEQLDQVLNASDDTREETVKTARKMIDDFNAHVKSDPVLAELDGNDILPDIKITGPLQAKLNEISTALG